MVTHTRPTRRARLSLVSLMVLPLATACGDSGGDASGPGAPPMATVTALSLDGAVPWIDQKPEPQRPVVPSPRPTAQPCRGEQLRVVSADSEGATGHLGRWVIVENTGGAACTLAGHPAVRGTDPSADRVDIPTAHGTWFDMPRSEERPATIAKGERASVIIESSMACDPQTGPPPYDFRDIELRVPDGTFLAVGGDYLSTCEPRVGPWHLPVHQVDDSTQWRSLRASIEAPSEVTVGTVLTYVVTLTNVSDDTVVLHPCPGYLQALGPTKSGGSFGLNCTEVPTMGAGQSVRFEMQLPVQDIPPISGPTEGLLAWKIWEGPRAKSQPIRLLP